MFKSITQLIRTRKVIGSWKFAFAYLNSDKYNWCYRIARDQDWLEYTDQINDFEPIEEEECDWLHLPGEENGCKEEDWIGDAELVAMERTLFSITDKRHVDDTIAWLDAELAEQFAIRQEIARLQELLSSNVQIEKRSYDYAVHFADEIIYVDTREQAVDLVIASRNGAKL